MFNTLLQQTFLLASLQLRVEESDQCLINAGFVCFASNSCSCCACTKSVYAVCVCVHVASTVPTAHNGIVWGY